MIGTGNLTNFSIDVVLQDTKYSGLYNGECVNGVASGKGVFNSTKDNDKFIYEGDFSNGEMTGSGTLEMTALTVNFSDVSRTGSYSGAIVNFMPEGYGEFKATNDNGDSYTISGDWKAGLQHGQSSQIFDDGSFSIVNGTFVNGVYTPTIIDVLTSMGTGDHMPFEVSQETLDFYNEHTSLFPAKNIADLKKLVDINIKYKHLSKNITNYYKNIIKLDQFYVVQVRELNNEVFHVYYPGKCDVYDGDIITLYGLPINMSSYDNVGGGTTLPCVMLGIFIDF